MKITRTLLTLLSSLLLCSFTNKPYVVSANDKQFLQSTAYDSTKALNFNACSEEEINTYYDYDTLMTKKGEDLRLHLHSKIQDTFYVTYDKATDWMKITDRNWELSREIDPATYRFSEDVGDNYRLNLLYFPKTANKNKTQAVNFDVNKSMTVDNTINYVDYANKKKPNSNIQVDKEHVWAKNHGFAGDPIRGAGTDLHHLIAADHTINSAAHNDLPFGEVADKENKDTHRYAYLGDGSSVLSGYRGLDKNGREVVEPLDEWKGNIARAMLYMVTRYGYQLPEGNSKEEPYLYFSDTEEDNNDKFHGVHPYLSMYLKWNALDPVDEEERFRNDLIYNNVQHNRNPFVDYYFTSDLSQYFANSVFDPNNTLLPDLTPDPFSNLKDTYQMHVGDNEDLLFNSELIDDFVVDYDHNYLQLTSDKKTLKAIKAGTVSVTFKGKIKGTDKEISKTSTFEIKKEPLLLAINPNVGKPTSLSFETNTTYTMQFFWVNDELDLFPHEEIIVKSDNPNLVTVEGNTLKFKDVEGSCQVSIVLHNKDNPKKDRAIFSFEVKVILSEDVKKEKQIYIIIIICAAILLIVVFIILGVLIHKSDKASSRDMKDKEFNVDQTKKSLKKAKKNLKKANKTVKKYKNSRKKK